MTDEDEVEPVGQTRKVRSIFWVGDMVLHRCDRDPDGRTRGLIVSVLFAAGGVRYHVQWSIAESATHDEVELELAGPGA